MGNRRLLNLVQSMVGFFLAFFFSISLLSCFVLLVFFFNGISGFFCCLLLGFSVVLIKHNQQTITLELLCHHQVFSMIYNTVRGTFFLKTTIVRRKLFFLPTTNAHNCSKSKERIITKELIILGCK